MWVKHSQKTSRPFCVFSGVSRSRSDCIKKRVKLVLKKQSQSITWREVAKEWALSLCSHLCWELHILYIFYLTLSFKHNTNWTMFERRLMEKFLHANVLNFNARHSIAPEKGSKLFHPGVMFTSLIVPFPTEDKSQMLVGVCGFLSSAKE